MKKKLRRSTSNFALISAKAYEGFRLEMYGLVILLGAASPWRGVVAVKSHVLGGTLVCQMLSTSCRHATAPCAGSTRWGCC